MDGVDSGSDAEGDGAEKSVDCPSYSQIMCY